MNEITLGEIARKLDSHIDESKQNNIKQNNMLETILVQATKTNGRVTRLEEETKDSKQVIEKHTAQISHFTGRENWILGGLGVILLVSGFFFKTLWENLEYRIQKTIKTEIAFEIEKQYEESKTNKQ